jgi:hypothetical protein
MKGVNDDGGDMGSWVRFAAMSWIVSMLSTSSSISSGNCTPVSHGRYHEHVYLTSTSISLSDMAGGRPIRVSC